MQEKMDKRHFFLTNAASVLASTCLSSHTDTHTQPSVQLIDPDKQYICQF